MDDDKEARVAKMLNDARKCGFSDPNFSDVLLDYFCGDDDASDRGKAARIHVIQTCQML
jgi:hypothetical protein